MIIRIHVIKNVMVLEIVMVALRVHAILQQKSVPLLVVVNLPALQVEDVEV
jgi:hypothetical protein